MKKELIIMLFKINVNNLNRQQAEQQIYELMNEYHMEDDIELKQNYIIRQIWIPIIEGESDVKIIYPTPHYIQSIELEDLVKSVTEQMKQYPNTKLVTNWNKIIRSLKLKNLYNE